MTPRIAALLFMIAGCHVEKGLSLAVVGVPPAARQLDLYVFVATCDAIDAACVSADTCPSAKVHAGTVAVRGGLPGELDAFRITVEGAYCLVAIARDASCVRLAYTEADVRFEGRDPVIPELTLIADLGGGPDCASVECIDGQCMRFDASVIDGGGDANPSFPDAGPCAPIRACRDGGACATAECRDYLVCAWDYLDTRLIGEVCEYQPPGTTPVTTTSDAYAPTTASLSLENSALFPCFSHCLRLPDGGIFDENVLTDCAECCVDRAIVLPMNCVAPIRTAVDCLATTPGCTVDPVGCATGTLAGTEPCVDAFEATTGVAWTIDPTTF